MLSGATSAIGAAAGGATQLIGRATGSGGDARVAPAPDQPGAADSSPAGFQGPADAGPSPSKTGQVLSKAAGAVDMATGAAGAAARLAAGSAGSAAAAAAPLAGSAGKLASSAAGSASTAAKQAADAAYNKAEDLASMSKERVQDMVRKLREYLEMWVKGKIQRATERAVDRLPGLTKNALEDPEMPRCVSRGKDRMIDNMWPEIREEIMWEVAVLIDGTSFQEDVTDERGVDCFRAFFRYHLMPFDKGIWGQLRDPVQLAFRLLALVPIYGLSQLMFLFVFLVIDKGDEFQLINFILAFKGTQFLSMGVIRAVTGFAMFMMCVTAVAEEGNHDCEKEGPGNRGAMLITSAGFILQVALVWMAFLLLRCASEKGRTKLKGHVEHEHVGLARVSGGYIRYFLWYDLLFFFISLLIPVYTFVTRPSDKQKTDDWVIAQAVFAAQIVYGLLSAPFFLFTLPGLQRVLTHAMPTAYDRQGRCRKPNKPKPPKEEPKRPEAGELVSEEDAETVFQKMRELFPFGSKAE